MLKIEAREFSEVVNCTPYSSACLGAALGSEKKTLTGVIGFSFATFGIYQGD